MAKNRKPAAAMKLIKWRSNSSVGVIGKLKPKGMYVPDCLFRHKEIRCKVMRIIIRSRQSVTVTRHASH